MNFNKKTILVMLMWAQSLFGGEYIVPKDYDNTMISDRAVYMGIVHNGASVISASSYFFSNRDLHLKCFIVPKIQCRPLGVMPVISTSYIEGSLRDSASGEEVAIYSNRIITESVGGASGTSWRVCGGLYGGDNWDKFDMTVNKNNTPGEERVTDVNATYIPNATKKEIWAFSDVSPSTDRGDGRSYMVIKTRQICP